MIFIDSNVLIDLIEGDGSWSGWSRRVVADVELDMPLAASVVVLAETSGHFKTLDDQLRYLDRVNVGVRDLTPPAARRAGRAHSAYRRAGGSRVGVLADFLIGGHAAALGATLLTRDRQRFSAYFPDLTLITPETHP
ncbi:type II toxin-antitoxin system VapC family toxin [Sphingomonas sp.]|uniref:type II toxin-antitoxin system VapC family toxin n=1 Tax=Sphingomonas sp. TaxID=28214 RepID=UPI003B00822A